MSDICLSVSLSVYAALFIVANQCKIGIFEVEYECEVNSVIGTIYAQWWREVVGACR